ncbi:RHS repeat-associated core domain-containing protein [Akkermansiaceae bacterium]|nr:RHS repeat-associated core domain-containing protein [Akkermansiaceae bacterium]
MIEKVYKTGGTKVESTDTFTYDAASRLHSYRLSRSVFRKDGSDEQTYLWWGDHEKPRRLVGVLDRSETTCLEEVKSCGAAMNQIAEHKSISGQATIQNDIWAQCPRSTHAQREECFSSETLDKKKPSWAKLSTALNQIIARAVEGNKQDLEFYHKNYLDHVNAVSDEDGDIVEHYRYTAFGEPEIYTPTGTKLASSAIDNPVLWNSRRYDADTELYYYKYRHYKSDIGRWLSRDPIEESGGINLYAFVKNISHTNYNKLFLYILYLINQGYTANEIRGFTGI